MQTHHLQAEFPEIPEMDLTFAPWFFLVRWIGGWMDREDLPVGWAMNFLGGTNEGGRTLDNFVSAFGNLPKLLLMVQKSGLPHGRLKACK